MEAARSGRVRRRPLATGPVRDPEAGGGTTEQRICEATERLLQRVRASDLTVEEILAEADISRRTFYSYYASKYGVLTSLAVRTLGEAYPAREPFFSGSTPDEQRAALRAGIDRACAVWAQHRAVLRSVMESWQDVVELRTIWVSMLDHFTEDLAGQIDSQRACGAAPQGIDSRRVAQTLVWSGAYTIYLSGLAETTHIPDEPGVVDLLVEAWSATVYGQGAGARQRGRSPRTTAARA